MVKTLQHHSPTASKVGIFPMPDPLPDMAGADTFTSVQVHVCAVTVKA